MLYQLSYASPTTTKHCREIPVNPRTHSGSAHNTAQFLRLAHRKQRSKPRYPVYRRHLPARNHVRQSPPANVQIVSRNPRECGPLCTSFTYPISQQPLSQSSESGTQAAQFVELLSRFLVRESLNSKYTASLSYGDLHETNFVLLCFGFVLLSRWSRNNLRLPVLLTPHHPYRRTRLHRSLRTRCSTEHR